MTDSTNLPAEAAVVEATTDDMAGMTAADQVGQAGASDRIQLAQAVVQVPTPAAGETVAVTVAPGQTIQFAFDYVAAGNGEVTEDGALVLPVNGGEVVLEGFAAAVTAQPPVELTNADGTVIELGDFLVAIDVPIDVLIDSAAGGGEPGGPLPDTTAPNQGAGFSPGNGPQILGNLDPEGPVDPTGLNYTVPERENTLFDLDEDDDGGDTPPEDDIPDAEDDGPNTTNEGFCLDEAQIDGGEGGQGDLQEPTNGSAMKTTVTVEAGAVLTFTFNFLDGEDAGQTSYLDFAVVVIGDQVFKLADVLTANLPNASGTFDEATGTLAFSFTFDAAGTYDIGFAVFNEGDESVDSALVIDNVSISDGSFADGFETGLGNWDVIGDASVQGPFEGATPSEGSQQAVLGPDDDTDVADIENFFGLPSGVMQDVLNADLQKTVLSDNVLDNDSFGADGPGGITGISYVGGIGDAGPADTSEPGKVTIEAADGSWRLEFYTSDANADGRDMGDYIFTLLKPIDHPLQGKDDLHGAFQYTIVDSDGDTDSATLSICIKDDVPTIEIFGGEGAIILDETENDGDDTAGDGLLASVSVFAGSLFGTDTDFGADFLGGTVTGALTISAPGADSGLVDTLTGEAVLLTLEGGQVVGRTELGGLEVFRVSFDNDTGNFTVTQSRAVVHDDPLDNDESDSPETLAPGLVGFEATITDGDGDTDSDSIDLGSLIKFEDDGPTLVGGEGGVTPIVLDETDNDSDDGDVGGLLATRTVSIASVLGGTVDFGSDGPAADNAFTAQFAAVLPDTGLLDAATDQQIILEAVSPFEVVGKLAGTGEEAFRITIDPSSGEITVTQSRAVEHDDPNDHDEAGSPETIQAGSLIIEVTATDGDGDSLDANVDLGQLIRFEDDGPTAGITLKPGAEIRLDETDNDADDGDVGGLLANVTVLGSALFTNTTAYGSDGEGSTAYSATLSENGVDSGLIDAATDQHIFLFEAGGTVYGVYGTDADDAENGYPGSLVFTISVDSGTGNVTVQQFRALEHDDTGDHDEAASPEIMDSGVLLLNQTVTDGDGDGDSDSASVDLGSVIKFEDDGPTLDVSPGTGGIILDETVDGGDDPNVPNGLLASATRNMDTLFTYSGNIGSDGSGSASKELSISADGVDSGLVDTKSGEAVVLTLEGGQVVGRTALGGLEVFRVSYDDTHGDITVTQSRAVRHDDPLDPDEAGSPETIAPGLISFSLTFTDGDGDSDTATADLGPLIKFEDDGPTLTTQGGETTTVDENDLPDGTDGTGPLTVSGDIGVDFGSDGPGEVTEIRGPAGLQSGGDDLFYSFENGVLTATAGDEHGPVVFTVSIDPQTGEYSFTLSGPIDHATGSDNQAVEIGFTVTDGDGDSVDSSFTVDVTDDVSEATDDTDTVNDGLDSINVTIMFDRSGSMDEDPGVDGFSTRIDLARAAIASLLQAYDSVADVNIKIVDFAGAPSTGGVADSSKWFTGPDAVQQAIAYMAGLDPDGNTDYSKAVEEAMNAYNDPSDPTPEASESVVYFLSDGNPTVGGDGTTYELTPEQITAWEAFLGANGIDTAFAVGVGNGVSGVTNISALQGIAYPSDDQAVIVEDGDLIDELLVTVSGEASGNVLDNDNFGADGKDAPAITKLTFEVGGVTDEYEFDGTNITKNGAPYSSGLGATIVVIVAAFGTLTFDFATGKYDYAASATGQDSFDYTIVDGDGDESIGSLVIDVGATGVQKPHLVFGTDGNDNNLLGHDDAIPDIISGGDGDDKLTAFDSDDLLIGGAGADALFGGGGDDVLIGGSQSEVKASQPAPIRAADGADYLDGGDGKDILFGNEGDDILVVRSDDEAHGGTGNDLFVLLDNVGFGKIEGDASTGSNLATVKGDILAFDGILDLTDIPNTGRISGIETISMRDEDGSTSHSIAGDIDHFANVGGDTLTLNASDVISMGSGVFNPFIASPDNFEQKDAIRVDGENGDTLNLAGGGWSQLTTMTNAPAGYNVWMHDSSGTGASENAYVLVQENVTVLTS